MEPSETRKVAVQEMSIRQSGADRELRTPRNLHPVERVCPAELELEQNPPNLHLTPLSLSHPLQGLFCRAASWGGEVDIRLGLWNAPYA